MSVDNNIVLRVSKLLRLAGNNPSEAEARSALLKAQEILATHGLTMSDVEDTSTVQKEVVKDSSFRKKRVQWWYRRLHVVLANHFRCTSIRTRYHRSGETALSFLGLKQDVEVVQEVYKFAVQAIRHHSDKYRKKLHKEGWWKGDINALTNDYIRGFIDGLDEKYHEQVEKNNWGLVLVKDALVIQKHEELTKGKKAKVPKFTYAGDDQAYDEGYKQGKSFNAPKGLLQE